MDIGNFLESDGSCQVERGRVGNERSPIQPANTSPLQLTKNPESKLGAEPRLPIFFSNSDVFGPCAVRSEFSRQVYQSKRGAVQTYQIEPGYSVTIERHKARLPGRNRSLQSPAQPLCDGFNLSYCVCVFSGQKLEGEIVAVPVHRRFGVRKIDSVDSIDLAKINRSNQVSHGLPECDIPSVVLPVATNFVK